MPSPLGGLNVTRLPIYAGHCVTTKTWHHASNMDPAKVGALLRAINGLQGSLVVACALKLAHGCSSNPANDAMRNGPKLIWMRPCGGYWTKR